MAITVTKVRPANGQFHAQFNETIVVLNNGVKTWEMLGEAGLAVNDTITSTNTGKAKK